jgi:tellurite resistance protein TehA-like permease
VCDAVFEGTGKGWWATFGIAGAALLLLLAVMYIVKMFLYPRKVLSEWDCPSTASSSPTYQLPSHIGLMQLVT